MCSQWIARGILHTVNVDIAATFLNGQPDVATLKTMDPSTCDKGVEIGVGNGAE